jgi:hypothetical protein
VNITILSLQSQKTQLAVCANGQALQKDGTGWIVGHRKLIGSCDKCEVNLCLNTSSQPFHTTGNVGKLRSDVLYMKKCNCSNKKGVRNEGKKRDKKHSVI